MLSIDDVLIGGRCCIGANKSNMPNRSNTFVITADEFNKPNYLLVEING